MYCLYYLGDYNYVNRHRDFFLFLAYLSKIQILLLYMQIMIYCCNYVAFRNLTSSERKQFAQSCTAVNNVECEQGPSSRYFHLLTHPLIGHVFLSFYKNQSE